MPQSATARTVIKVERDEENLTARQNPQAPPTLAVPSNDDLNNQMQNQMTAYTHREQRRVSYKKSQILTPQGQSSERNMPGTIVP